VQADKGAHAGSDDEPWNEPELGHDSEQSEVGVSTSAATAERKHQLAMTELAVETFRAESVHLMLDEVTTRLFDVLKCCRHEASKPWHIEPTS
jgi:hypothetical protein